MTALILTMSAIPVSVPLSADPDAAALDRLRAGDRGAAAGIWERHGEAVWRVAVRCCPHPADAEDVMQEVALDLLSRPPAAIHGGGLRAWLCLAAANRSRKRLRDEGRRGRRQMPLDDRPAPVPAEPPALAERAFAALAALPTAYREPVRLRCVERLDFTLVAAACGIGERAARTRVSRGLARLREVLGVPGTGLAGIALILPVRPVPGMPADLTTRLMVTPTAVVPVVGAGTIAAVVGGGVLVAGVAAVVAGGGGAVHGGGAGADAVPASATMAALRAWRDPTAALQIEVDFDRLRGPALALPPLDALADERTRELHRWLSGWEGRLAKESPRAYLPMIQAVAASIRAGGGFTLWKPDTRPRLPVIAVDVGQAGIAAPDLDERIGTARVRTVTAWGAGERRVVVQDGPRWVIGLASALDRLGARAPHTALAEAPAWLRYDATTLVEAYARLAPPGLDPAGVSEVLGPGWRAARPVLTATAAIDAWGWVGAARLTGVGPFQPLRAVEALPADLRRAIGPFRPMADTCRLASDPDDLVRLDLGIRVDPRAAAGWLRDAGFDAALLSGDVSLRMRPGVPFPRLEAALGVRGDGASVAAGIARSMGLQLEPVPAEGPWSASAWTGVTLFGEVSLRWNREAVAIVSGTTAAPRLGPAWSAGDAVLRIDGPRTAAVALPLLAMAGMTRDPDVAEAIRLLRPAIPHLPVWDLTASTTDDGFVAGERGATLLVPGLALLSDIIMDSSDPVGETERGMLSARVEALLTDRAMADLVGRLRCRPGMPRGAVDLPERLRQCRIEPKDLAAVLGLPATTPAEQIGSPIRARTLTFVDPRQPQSHMTYTTDGSPIPGWEIPLGNGLSLLLVEFINSGRDIHIGLTTSRLEQGGFPPRSATTAGGRAADGTF
ncbi:MAG: hypothetical protein RLZZ127_851 [Planctomycetota bacterium]|jgi:RNA polymerase sigma-70 factor (ECF subfamily)